MNKNKILYITAVALLLGLIFGVVSKRLDLTQEKRYTLTEATIKTLKSVKKPMMIEVYLDGDFPASFKQLQNETKFILEEFRKINPKIDYKFRDPIKEKISRDTLMAMGMQPSILPDMKDGKISEIVLFPYAAVKYNTYGSSIPLIVEQSGLDASEQLNRSIESLEYSFVSTIKAMVTEQRKNIGFLVNHQELGPLQFQGFLSLALDNYNIGPIIPKNSGGLTMEDVPTLRKMDALVIAKPRKPFTDQEKLILDQYIMNGGRTLWMLDVINAEMDTLYHAKKIMAYPQDLNLTDFMFNYGLRINSALVKDFQKAALRTIVVGEVAGNPQYANLLWPYFPIGINETNNPITRNINPVKFEFPTAIDTLGRKDIKTKVLYESSPRTTLKTVPNYVELNEIQNLDSLTIMEKPSTPKIFAVALEGKFSSAYANRSERNEYPNFKNKSAENKMIVISDGDVARNAVLKGEPLPLGEDLYTNQRYGNAQFLRNALDFLLDDDNLIDLRSRSVEIRLLDQKLINDEKSYWQWFNLLLPLLFISGLGGLFFWLRKKKFG
ncbi:MAG: gliding motility-associated ABC transporter substrate-binding protein GldG [Riemerella sp.]|nr:MAG: gliding motility-associated ABC transporter substrate-binding protein GldG [Riemerella sp.]